MNAVLAEDLTPGQLRNVFIEAGVPEELLLAIEDERPSNGVIMHLYSYANDVSQYIKTLNSKLLTAKKQADDANSRAENSSNFVGKLRLANERQSETLHSYEESDRKNKKEINELKQHITVVNRKITKYKMSKQRQLRKFLKTKQLIGSRYKLAVKRSIGLSKLVRQTRCARLNETAALKYQLEAKDVALSAKDAEISRLCHEKEAELANFLNEKNMAIAALEEKKTFEIDDLRREVDKTAKRRDKLQSKLDAVTGDYQKLKTELEAEREKLKAVSKECALKMEQQAADFSTARDKLSQENSLLSTDLAKVREELQKNRQRHETADSLSKQVKDELSLENQSLKSDLDKAHQEAKTLRTKYDDSKKMYFHLKDSFDRMEKSHAQMAKELLAANKQVQQLQQQLQQQQQQQIISPVSSVVSFTSPTCALSPPQEQPTSAELEATKKIISHLHDALRAVQKENQDLLDKLNEKSTQFDQLMNQLDDLKEQLSQKSALLDQQIEERRKERDELDKQLTKLLGELDQKKQDLIDLGGVNMTNWKMNLLLKTELEAKESQLAVKNKEIEKLQSASRESEVFNKEVEKLRKTNRNLEQRWHAHLASQNIRSVGPSRRIRLMRRAKLNLVREKLKLKRELFKAKRYNKSGIEQLVLSKRINDRKDKLIAWLKSSLSTKTKRIDQLETDISAKESRLAVLIASQIKANEESSNPVSKDWNEDITVTKRPIDLPSLSMQNSVPSAPPDFDNGQQPSSSSSIFRSRQFFPSKSNLRNTSTTN